MVDENEAILLDFRKAFTGEMPRAFAAFRAEKIQGNTFLGPQAECDAFEAAGFGIEGF